ncbi:MAG TPA: DUF3078 domain-containing protein [Cyclobacteriaceae bacterium]|jgi:hypothetical protein|nr:DUF3078 domain-containing protein [Cyclobacteriaceae bacterium]
MKQLPHHTLFFAALVASVTTCFSQIVKIDSTSKWRKAFKAGLNVNQASFTSNWKAGGVNSLGITAFLNYKANYKGEHNSWDSEIDLLYGMVNNQGLGYRKTLDRIFLDTRYGHELSKHWDLSASVNFLTQFAPGYKYLKSVSGADSLVALSDFLAPAFLTAGLGFEYHPVKYFKLRLSPVAPRLTIVNDVTKFVTTDNPQPYGVSVNRTSRMDWLAFQMLAEFDKDIAKNVNLKWRYIFFANYEKLSAENLYHRLDLNLTAKLGRFMNASFGTILLYDHNQDNSVQVSQAFSLGVLYTFQNYQDKK